MGYQEEVAQRHHDLIAIKRFRDTTLEKSRTGGTSELRLAGEDLFREVVRAVKVLEQAIIIADPHGVNAVVERLCEVADRAATASEEEIDYLNSVEQQTKQRLREAEIREFRAKVEGKKK